MPLKNKTTSPNNNTKIYKMVLQTPKNVLYYIQQLFNI